MAQPSTELLNTTLADLGSSLVLTHAQSLPLMDKLIKGKQVNCIKRGGTYIERSFIGGSPAKGKRIANGDEVAVLQRKTQTRKLQVVSTRHLIPIFIPQTEVDHNEGSQGIIKLIKAYPEATIKEYWLDWEYWLLTAAYRDAEVSVIDSPEFEGACTLNGVHSAGAAGLLDFVVQASQIDTVQGVAKNNALGYTNQYGVITSFAADGMLIIGRAYDRAANFSLTGPDLGYADDITYQNMSQYSADNVRISDTDKPVYGAESRSFLPYKRAKVFNTINLDPSNASFTGSTAHSTSDITGGCLYFLNSEDWEVPYYRMQVTPEFKDDIPDQDALVGKMIIDMQPICKRLNTQAAIAGGRIP